MPMMTMSKASDCGWGSLLSATKFKDPISSAPHFVHRYMVHSLCCVKVSLLSFLFDCVIASYFQTHGNDLHADTFSRFIADQEKNHGRTPPPHTHIYAQKRGWGEGIHNVFPMDGWMASIILMFKITCFFYVCVKSTHTHKCDFPPYFGKGWGGVEEFIFSYENSLGLSECPQQTVSCCCNPTTLKLHLNSLI